MAERIILWLVLLAAGAFSLPTHHHHHHRFESHAGHHQLVPRSPRFATEATQLPNPRIGFEVEWKLDIFCGTVEGPELDQEFDPAVEDGHDLYVSKAEVTVARGVGVPRIRLLLDNIATDDRLFGQMETALGPIHADGKTLNGLARVQAVLQAWHLALKEADGFNGKQKLQLFSEENYGNEYKRAEDEKLIQDNLARLRAKLKQVQNRQEDIFALKKKDLKEKDEIKEKEEITSEKFDVKEMEEFQRRLEQDIKELKLSLAKLRRTRYFAKLGDVVQNFNSKVDKIKDEKARAYKLIVPERDQEWWIALRLPARLKKEKEELAWIINSWDAAQFSYDVPLHLFSHADLIAADSSPLYKLMSMQSRPGQAEIARDRLTLALTGMDWFTKLKDIKNPYVKGAITLLIWQSIVFAEGLAQMRSEGEIWSTTAWASQTKDMYDQMPRVNLGRLFETLRTSTDKDIQKEIAALHDFGFVLGSEFGVAVLQNELKRREKRVVEVGKRGFVGKALQAQLDLQKPQYFFSDVLFKLLSHCAPSLAIGPAKSPGPYPPAELLNFESKVLDKPVGALLDFAWTEQCIRLLTPDGQMFDLHQEREIGKPIEYNLVMEGRFGNAMTETTIFDRASGYLKYIADLNQPLLQIIEVKK